MSKKNEKKKNLDEMTQELNAVGPMNDLRTRETMEKTMTCACAHTILALLKALLCLADQNMVSDGRFGCNLKTLVLLLRKEDE